MGKNGEKNPLTKCPNKNLSKSQKDKNSWFDPFNLTIFLTRNSKFFCEFEMICFQNSWKFVYILAEQSRYPFNLTRFLTEKNSKFYFHEIEICFKKTCWDILCNEQMRLFLPFSKHCGTRSYVLGENGYQGAVLGFRFYNRTIKTSFPFRYSA